MLLAHYGFSAAKRLRSTGDSTHNQPRYIPCEIERTLPSRCRSFNSATPPRHMPTSHVQFPLRSGQHRVPYLPSKFHREGLLSIVSRNRSAASRTPLSERVRQSSRPLLHLGREHWLAAENSEPTK